MGIEGLENVVNEMDVQDRYRTALRRAFSDIVFESKFRTDGLGYSKSNNLRMLLEQKYKHDFNKISERSEVVAQTIAYIKKIHDNDPTIVPKVILIGDENETLLIEVLKIINYISLKNYDWSITPSKMFLDKNLCNDLSQDEYIKNLFVYNPKTQFKEIVSKIKEINKGIHVPRVLTEKNIDRVFQYFSDKITIKRSAKKINDNDSVNLFAHIMLHPDSVMFNEKTKLLFTGMFKEPLSISDIYAYKSFIQEYSRIYTPKQKHFFTAILDRLIKDTTRRKQGEFFTPTIWVDKAHEYIASVYGEDWKEKYVVWDPAWGTGNLTRDYKFKELYVSTLNQSDIDTANQMGYNPEAVKFQYDFLNDDYEKLPVGLRNAIESGRQIIVLMNPPYATAKGGAKKNDDKIGNADTLVGKEMKDLSYDKSSAQLFAQFMFRILKKINGSFEICMFSPSSYKTSTSFKKIRQDINEKHNIVKSFIFDSQNFDSTSGGWAIDFSVISQSYEGTNKSDILEFDNFEIVKKGEKEYYSTDEITRASDWVRKSEKKEKTVQDFPNLSSPLKIKNGKNLKINTDNFLGGYTELSNSVYQNQNGVSLYSAIGVLGNTKSVKISPENFLNVCGMFYAKKSVQKIWTNDKDEYLAPNEEHEDYQQFTKDSLVYSLFHIHSFQSSLRQVTYKDKLWDIKNEFFWMSKEEMMELANNNNYNELYNDARTDNNRYVYNLLFGEQNIYEQLSPDAKLVLDKATELVRLSMNMRSHFADDHNHLNSWDAGYAQLKLVWKKYFSEEFKEFRQLYKNLEDRMRPLVYELGFLIK